MKFSQLTANRQALRDRSVELDKEAGAIATGVGKVISAPFRAAGAVAGKTVSTALKGAHKGAWALSQKATGGNKPLAGLVYAGGALGTVAAGKAAIGKSREYRQGFNPAYQQAKTYGYGQ